MNKILLTLIFSATLSPVFAADETKDAVERLYHKDFSTGFVLPKSVVTSQGIVNFTVGGLSDGFVQLAYECGTKKLFINFVQPNNNSSYYPNRQKQYSEPQAIKTSRASKLLQSDAIQAACQA